jgi:hypothetical protein
LITKSDELQIVGRSLEIHLASPASILVTDALGRKLGHDPRTGISYKEIPTGEYWSEADISTEEAEGPVHENKNATVLEPTASPYTVEVIGEDEGEYYLSLYTNNTNGSSTIRDFASSTALGVVHVYRAYFTDDPLNGELLLLQEFIDWLKANSVPKGMQKAVGVFVAALEPQVEAGIVTMNPPQIAVLSQWKQRQAPASGYEFVQRILKNFGY